MLTPDATATYTKKPRKGTNAGREKFYDKNLISLNYAFALAKVF